MSIRRYSSGHLALGLASESMGTNNNQYKTLATWRAWQQAQGLSQRTITDRELTMVHFLNYTGANPQQITSDDILYYVGRAGLSQGSRATYHKHIRAFSRWLIRTGRRPDDPTLGTPVPKQPRGIPHPVNTGDLPLILEAANRRRTRMMVLLASLQGLRVHEIAKIRGEDINIGDLSLLVTGKGNKTAYVPLHGTVATFSESFPAAGYWFPSYRGKGPITPGAVSRAIGSAMTRAGVSGHAHMLRHWYGTSLVRNGVDLRTVQKLLRHESLVTTQIYTLVYDEQTRTAIDGLRIS